MTELKQPLSENDQHFHACHVRWMPRRNRKVEEENYRDDWFDEQCLHCCFFIPISGVFIEDWGACTNSDSPFDGRVMFEHDGCEKFVRSESVWFVSSEEEEANLQL